MTARPADRRGYDHAVRGRTRRLLGCALIAASFMTPALPSPAPAAEVAPAEPVGINGGSLFPDGTGALPTARHVQAIARSGLTTVRAVAFWDQAEPQAPTAAGHRYDWRRSDAMVQVLASEGLRLDAVLCCQTPWGSALPGAGGSRFIADFAAYAGAFAARYGRRGGFWRAHAELPYAPVTTYQIWNEPNLAAFWPPAPQPDRYAALFLAAAAAIRQVDPAARVAVGGLSQRGEAQGAGVGFLAAMFAARPDVRGAADAVGVTIYVDDAAAVLREVAAVRRTLDAHDERDTPIDIDETGWATQSGLPLTGLRPVTEAARATLYRDLVARLKTADCGVASVTPYAWVTSEDGLLDPSAWLGIADRATARLKPAGAAFVDALREPPGARGAAAPPCGRPDLPRLSAAREREPFALRIGRCRGGRRRATWTAGAEPEPYARVVVRVAGRRRETMTDPDGAGPRRLPVALRLRPGARGAAVRAAAYDELGRRRAVATARAAPCPPRRGVTRRP